MRIPKAHYNIISKEISEASIEKRGNLIIPDLGKEKPLYAEVVSVGLGFVTQAGTILAPVVKVGDIIVLPKVTATRMVIDGETYMACTELNIQAIVVEEEVKKQS